MQFAAEGEQHYNHSEWKEAADCFRSALDKAGDTPQLRAICLQNLAAAIRNLGELDKAIRMTEEAASLAHAAGDERTEAHCLGNLGNFYSDRGLYDQSEKAHLASLNIAERLGDTFLQRARLSDLGTVYQLVGQGMKAVDCYRRAVTLSEKIEDKRGLSYALSNLVSSSLDGAAAARALSMNPDLCRDVMRQAREITGVNLDIEPSEFFGAMMQHCMILCNRSLAISEELEDWQGVARQYLHRALIFRLLGKPEASLRAYKTALQISERTRDLLVKAECMVSIGSLYLEIGEADKAIGCYHNALAVGSPAPEVAYLANQQLAIAYCQLGNHVQAFRHYAAAIEHLEHIRSNIRHAKWKESFVAEKVGVYARMIRLLCLDMDNITWQKLRMYDA